MVNWWFGLVVWDTNSPLVDLGGFSVLSFLKKSPKHVFFSRFWQSSRFDLEMFKKNDRTLKFVVNTKK